MAGRDRLRLQERMNQICRLNETWAVSIKHDPCLTNTNYQRRSQFREVTNPDVFSHIMYKFALTLLEGYLFLKKKQIA